MCFRRLAIQVDAHQLEAVTFFNITRNVQAVITPTEVGVSAIICYATKVTTACGDNEDAGLDRPVRRRQIAATLHREND